MGGWSLLVVFFAAVAVAMWSPYSAVALGTGGVCGVLNALLVMRANERLIDHHSVPLFVLGGLLRICVFGLVPVEFALHGPWWTIGAYFAAFFTPLATYWVLTARAVRAH